MYDTFALWQEPCCTAEFYRIYSEEMFSEIDDLDLFDLDNETLKDLLNLDGEIINPSWKKRPIQEWSAVEVVDFIGALGLGEVQNTYRFQCISGFIFKNLSMEHCQKLANSKELGTIIYEAKENYVTLNPVIEEDYYSVIGKEHSENTHTSNQCDISKENAPKRPGRPKSNSKKRGKEKSEKLWEFLLNLLRDQKTELIKWENHEEGTFKFVNNNTVARLWGSRNHNKTMNYEKFTRALRYHYKNKVLLPVPGKRLVYKFGPQAKGWNIF